MTGRTSLYAIDSHTMGEPTRIILEGFPEVGGNTIMEKKINLQKNYDYIRRAVINEPRGHRDMFGAVILTPTQSEADLGVVFMDGGGYLNMCGHGSIGAATVAVDQKLVPVVEPYTEVTLEAPAGLIHTRVKVENGKAREVSIVNVPAFLYKKGAVVAVPQLGEVTLDIAFGGNFFALVDVRKLGSDLNPQNLDFLVDAGIAIRDAVNAQIPVQHPLLTDIRSVDLVEFYGPAQSEGAMMRNIVVFGERQVDRSPCGTGTSAKLASLYACGEIKLGEDFIYESIMGTRFRGRALRETTVGEFPAIVPEITGSAYVTGRNTLILDDDDPFEYGFELV